MKRSARARGDQLHVPVKGAPLTEPKRRRGKARRWKVERTHSWFNRARRILIRWEQQLENYDAFLQLQAAIITLRSAGVLG